jgi:hypothetical protein
MRLRVAAIRTAIVIEALFKPGTPKSMRDKDLDAKERIIAEPIARFVETRAFAPVVRRDDLSK